jgi:GntR family transcriptional regulator
MKEFQLPKYLSITNIIIERIQKHELLPGSRIPSENEIIRDYQVSNTTARKVLLELESGGWATKIQGKGTIVKDFIVGRNAAKVLSFTKNMKDQGLTPSTKLIDSNILKNDVSINVVGKIFIIPKPVFKIRRLRLANNTPMMHETRYISLFLCPDIQSSDLEQSLYSFYKEQCNLTISKIEQNLSAIFLDEYSRKLFDVGKNIPGMRVDGVTFCNNDQLLEGEESIYRADKYKFSVQAVPDDI